MYSGFKGSLSLKYVNTSSFKVLLALFQISITFWNRSTNVIFPLVKFCSVRLTSFVVKPIKGGSSVGVNIIKKGNKIPYVNELNKKQLMAEIFVGSKELSVTVLKENPLCVTEITTLNDQEFYNYKAKYDKNGSSHIIPADIPKVIYKKALSWALKAHQIIGCRGISRSDFRYDENNEKLYMLELNTQPGMTKTSLSPEQAAYCGINLNDMIKILLEEAVYEC